MVSSCLHAIQTLEDRGDLVPHVFAKAVICLSFLAFNVRSEPSLTLQLGL